MNPQDIIPLISGAGGSIVVLAIVVWYQAKEKAALQKVIAGKDDDLKGLTRESIAGITTLAGLNQQNQDWQKTTTATLELIKDKLP